MVKPIYLGVNIDHVATLREARGVIYPEPAQAAGISEQAGADGITMHLREDRRHIRERDVYLVSEIVQTKLNLEMAVTDEMLNFACKLRPADCCLVPEKREELTTEGGLDVAGQLERMKDAVAMLTECGVNVSPFIDPDERQLDAAAAVGAQICELHTGHYANARTEPEQDKYFAQIVKAVEYGGKLGITINAGHGLNYHNTARIARINDIHELNIGHAIIAQALFSGLVGAVKQMKDIMTNARKMR